MECKSNTSNADDAYNAIKQAREDLKGFNSPNKAEYCIKED